MSVKKILVVATSRYENLLTTLDNFENSLSKEIFNEPYEFYIVNVIFNGEMPKNIKYKYYIHSSDCNNIEELERIAKEVKKWNVKFDYNFQISEYGVEILGYINSKLNFDGIKYEEIHKFRDKVIMKKSLSETIKKPKLYDIDDIKNDKVIYPVIVKPRCFASSWGIKKICSKDELLIYLKDKKFDYSRVSNYNLNDVEVEEYIDGNICHIDGLVFNGKVIFCVASEYFGTCFGYSKGQPLCSVKGNDNFQNKALIYANEINKNLRLPNGAFHLEAFLINNDFIFLEIAIRFGGAGVVPSIEKSYGINLIHEHIKTQIGINNFKIRNDFKYFGWICIPRPLELKVDSYVKKINFEYKPKSLFSYQIPDIGEKVNASFVKFSSTLGSFDFVSNNRDELISEMKKLLLEYKVEY